MSAVLVLDLGGGATLPFSFPPRNAGGDFLPAGSYESVGIARARDPNAVALDETFGIPMNPSSRLLQGMKEALGLTSTDPNQAVAAAAMAARVNGYITCVANADDTQNNEHSLLMGLPKLGYNKLIAGLGNRENPNGSGGNSAPVADWFDPANTPVTVRRREDALNIVLPPVLKDYLPSDSYDNVTSLIKSWSTADQAYFLSQSPQQQADVVKQLADKVCVYENSGVLISRYSPNQIDFDMDPNQDFRNLWNNDKGTGAIVKLLADDIASGGVITMGGYDYHGQGAPTQNQRDLAAGLMLGRFIRSFCLKGKNAMISIVTDGGTSNNAGPEVANEQRIAATGDSGNRGLRVTFFVNGAGQSSTAGDDTLRPEMTSPSRQFGGYNNTGAVNTQADPFFSSSPAKCCAIDLLNLLIFDGNMDLANRLELPDPKKYGLMVETKKG
jgi:hypothetical protein